jgi:hypothetical protein
MPHFAFATSLVVSTEYLLHPCSSACKIDSFACSFSLDLAAPFSTRARQASHRCQRPAALRVLAP